MKKILGFSIVVAFMAFIVFGYPILLGSDTWFMDGLWIAGGTFIAVSILAFAGYLIGSGDEKNK